ncbi:WhiB family transcriptional regulator [Brachybacterium sp. EF45031]|uniref:WhiB family transcriptional regulator n=1 Tax=Brachybacterium sillae TaxID=2810536 RepID=UPI0032E7FEE6|nr:WhiB family transcriptional regulator [Brachybacterium sillae]
MTDLYCTPAPTRQVDLPCQDHAATELFFSERPADLEAAKALCGPCPLRVECLEGALHRAEPWGVWGGAILVDGQIVAVKRGRGRPRKTGTAAAAPSTEPPVQTPCPAPSAGDGVAPPDARRAGSPSRRAA